MKVNYTTDYEETYCIPAATAALLNITTSQAIEAIGGNYAGNSMDFYRAASTFGFNPMYDFTAEGKTLGQWIKQAQDGRYAVFMGTKTPHCIAIEVNNGKAVIADTLNPDGAEFGQHKGNHPRTKIAVVRKMD